MTPLQRLAALTLAAGSGCVRTAPDTPDGTADGQPAACSACELGDVNNFTYESTLSLPVHVLAEEADVAIDWSALTTDIRGGALDPTTDVDDVWLVVFQDVEPTALTEAIANDQLQQESVTLFVTCTPVDASCSFSDFDLLGNDLGVSQYFTEGRGSWLVVLNSEAEGIVQSMGLLQAAAAATDTTVSLTDADAVLSADVDLGSLTPVVVAPDTTDITVDWSALTRDGLGNPLSVYTLDRLLVGRVSATVPEVEDGFFALETLADETWEIDVSSRTSASLTELVGDTPFAGVTPGDDTWLLGLFCGTCDNPAPRFLTRLEPESP
jgi:hypothetical protein